MLIQSNTISAYLINTHNLSEIPTNIDTVLTSIVDKETMKRFSSNDFTSANIKDLGNAIIDAEHIQKCVDYIGKPSQYLSYISLKTNNSEGKELVIKDNMSSCGFLYNVMTNGTTTFILNVQIVHIMMFTN